MAYSFTDDLLRATLPGPMASFHGVKASHRHRSTASLTANIDVIRTDPTEEQQYPGGTVILSIFSPSQIPTVIQKGDVFILDGAEYAVFDVRTESTGFVRAAVQRKG